MARFCHWLKSAVRVEGSEWTNGAEVGALRVTNKIRAFILAGRIIMTDPLCYISVNGKGLTNETI